MPAFLSPKRSQPGPPGKAARKASRRSRRYVCGNVACCVACWLHPAVKALGGPAHSVISKYTMTMGHGEKSRLLEHVREFESRRESRLESAVQLCEIWACGVVHLFAHQYFRVVHHTVMWLEKLSKTPRQDHETVSSAHVAVHSWAAALRASQAQWSFTPALSFHTLQYLRYRNAATARRGDWMDTTMSV
jgi:hypothetical protein